MFYLEGIDHTGAQLVGAHLNGANLNDKILNGVNLKGAQLVGAQLVGRELIGANLDGANLNGANLQGAHLEYANLIGAQLVGADLTGAHLNRARLQGAQLVGAQLVETKLIDAHLTGANLNGANLQGADLQGSDLIEGTDLIGANLIGANLRNTKLQGAHLEHADLVNAHLTDANLTGAHLTGAHLTIAQSERARLQNAHIEGAVVFSYHYHTSLANEVHIQFRMLDIETLLTIMSSENKPVNSNTLEPNDRRLFGPLRAFVLNSNMEHKKTILIKLDLICSLVEENNSYYYDNLYLFEMVFHFVARQSDAFIKLYIGAYVDECTNAYDPNKKDVSCVAGMVERIVTTLASVTGLEVHDPSFHIVEKLKEVFKTVDFQETVQEWFTLYAVDGTQNHEIASLTPDQRKQHFIDFMKRTYFVESQAYQGPDVRANIKHRITEDARELEGLGVFETMEMAGIRRKRSTKRIKKRRLLKTTKRRRTRTKKHVRR